MRKSPSSRPQARDGAPRSSGGEIDQRRLCGPSATARCRSASEVMNSFASARRSRARGSDRSGSNRRPSHGLRPAARLRLERDRASIDRVDWRFSPPAPAGLRPSSVASRRCHARHDADQPLGFELRSLTELCPRQPKRFRPSRSSGSRSCARSAFLREVPGGGQRMRRGVLRLSMRLPAAILTVPLTLSLPAQPARFGAFFRRSTAGGSLRRPIANQYGKAFDRIAPPRDPPFQ